MMEYFVTYPELTSGFEPENPWIYKTVTLAYMPQ